MNNTLHKGPYPLMITKHDDAFVIISDHATHYATTYDPSAARLISAAPDLLSALKFLLADYVAIGGERLTGSDAPLKTALSAIAKAGGYEK
jgi:hypothetical protein